MAKYNWEEIKAKYETGKYTLKQLADIYGDSDSFYSYLRQMASEEGWKVNEETSKKLAKEVSKKVVQDEVNKETELRLEYEKLINNTRRGAYNALMNEKNFDRLKQFKIFSEILRNCRSEQWEVNGIQEAAKKIEQELSGPGGGPMQVESDLSHLPMEDLKKLAEKYEE